MTYKEYIKNEKRWDKKVLIIDIYHHKMLLKNNKWTMRRTAQRLGLSIGAVCEAIKLSKWIKLEPKIATCNSRNEALKKIKHNGS